MCSWVALLGISGALDWNFREKSDHNFALLSLFRCSISLFLFLVQIPTTQRHRPANYRLPEAAKKSWELLRKSCPEFAQRLDRIGKTYVAHVTLTCQRRGFLSCAPPSLIQPIYTPPYTPYTAEEQFSELALSQPQVTRLAPDGNSRRWERWLDNIWLEQSQA